MTKELGGTFVQETPGGVWHQAVDERTPLTLCAEPIPSGWDWETTGIMLERLICPSCLSSRNGCAACRVGDHIGCTAEAGDCTTICHPVH